MKVKEHKEVRDMTEKEGLGSPTSIRRPLGRCDTELDYFGPRLPFLLFSSFPDSIYLLELIELLTQGPETFVTGTHSDGHSSVHLSKLGFTVIAGYKVTQVTICVLAILSPQLTYPAK